MNDEIRISNDELPEGWLRAPFSAVTVNPVQRVPSEKEEITYIDIGSVDRITKQVVEPQRMLGKDAPSRARKVIETGDVLVSTVRPNLNAVALVDSQYNGQFASTGFDVLRSPVVDPRWLFYSVRTPEFLDRMSELVQGALYPAVRSFDIRSFVIPIAPLAEQKRIADKLEVVLGRVDACRARLDRVPALLKRFRQSVLAAAISGNLTEEWRDRNPVTESGSELLKRILRSRRETWTGNADYKEPQFVPPSRVPMIPTSWKWVGLRQVGELQLGRQRAPQHSSGQNMRPYLRVANVMENRLDLTDVKSMNFTPKEFPRYCLQYGDILLNEGQTPELVGRPAMYRDEIPGCCYQKTLHRFRASEGVLAQFALTVFRSYMHNGRFTAASSITTNIAHLTQKNLVEIEFPLPPLPEQQEIVRRVEDLFAFADRTEARLASAQKTVERLTPATLAKAFRGELVPQDPNDEPASTLLARLGSQPAAKPAKAKRITSK